MRPAQSKRPWLIRLEATYGLFKIGAILVSSCVHYQPGTSEVDCSSGTPESWFQRPASHCRTSPPPGFTLDHWHRDKPSKKRASIKCAASSAIDTRPSGSEYKFGSSAITTSSHDRQQFRRSYRCIEITNHHRLQPYPLRREIV